MLTIKKRLVDPGIVVLEVSGTLTLGRDCQQVEWQLADLLSDNQTKVVFDLTELNQLDSTGIGIVVMCSGKLKKAGGELRNRGRHGNGGERPENDQRRPDCEDVPDRSRSHGELRDPELGRPT